MLRQRCAPPPAPQFSRNICTRSLRCCFVPTTYYPCLIRQVHHVVTKRAEQTDPPLSERLGVAVVRVEEISLDLVIRNAPSPPPPMAPPQPPSPPATPSPTYRSVSVVFLAPSHVKDNTLATARWMSTIFARAFDVPSSWLRIAVAENADDEDAQAGKAQAAFLMTIEIEPEHYSLGLLTTSAPCSATRSGSRTCWRPLCRAPPS